MSSYPYSIDNVRQILKELNVTGKMKRDWMHVVRGNDDIDLVQVRQEYNTLRKEYHKMEKDNSDELLEMRERLSEKKQNIQDTEDDIIDDIYKRISQKDIRLQINVQQTKDKKSIFEAKDRESYFLCKLINHELERVYKIETYFQVVKAAIDCPSDIKWYISYYSDSKKDKLSKAFHDYLSSDLSRLTLFKLEDILMKK